MAPVEPRVVMLGAAPEAGGSIGGLVDAYRAQGLFKRWPVEYLATHARGAGAQRNAALASHALRRFLAILVHEPGAVVHLHTEATPGFWRDAVFMSLALAARCAVVLHLHGGGFQRLHEGAGVPGRAVIRWLFERAACVVAPCEALRSWVCGAARRAHAVCLTSPVAAFDAPQDAARPNLVLFFGRLEAATGVFDLLEAVAQVRATVPDVRLVCAGDGDRAAVARYAERLDIADVVKCTGWVGPSGKRALLESAAVLALPSYEEALPASLLEAMAAGVPAVVSPVGGVPEVVVDGVSGFFAAPGDIATLQRLLRRLLVDRALAARVGAAARESVRLRCAPERVAARLGELYAALGVRATGQPAALELA